MKLTELNHLISQAPQTHIHIQSHREGVYFTVEIQQKEMTHQLRALNGKPMVFRDEESARNMLQQAGIKQVKARRVLPSFSALAQPNFKNTWQARLA